MTDQNSEIIKADGQGRWKDITQKPYKTQQTSRFDGVARYPLIDQDNHADSPIDTRYFEIEPDGYSSLEWHEHPHTVIVLGGTGSIILGNSYQALAPHDIVYIAPRALHQFLADRNSKLGFICIVPSDRDRPRYPSGDEILKIIPDKQVRDKIRPIFPIDGTFAHHKNLKF
ncbi:MAG: cupin domain-containing protein [Bacteroidota bacterium]